MNEFNPNDPAWNGLFSAKGKPALGQGDCEREGQLLVVRKGTRLPDYCVKCGEPAEHRLPRKLTWHPPGYYFVILAGVLVYFILALCIRETAKIDIGLCERHWRRRRTWIAWGWMIALGGIAAIVAGSNSTDLGVLIALGMLMFLFGLIGAMIGSQLVTPTKIDNRFAWLKGCHPDFLVIACGSGGGPMSDPWIDGP